MSPETSWLVVCVCAGWCRTCDEYRLTFDAVARESVPCRFVWIDIEEQSELMDDFDVATFPTLLIGHDLTLCFAGPLTPQPETLARLLCALRTRKAVAVQDGPAQALWLRLRRSLCAGQNEPLAPIHHRAKDLR